ncbi:MAG TPA: hypothetical protein VF345_03630 [Chthoniobacterales bacterium]
MKVIEDKLNIWDKRSLLIACLTYAVAALGIVMAALQAAKSQWIKGGTAALAVVSALIVSFTHQFFPADDRAYQKAAKRARGKLTTFRLELAQFHDLDEATKANLYQKFGRLIGDVDEIENSTIYNAISTANVSAAAQPSLGVSLLSTAWAGQNLAMLPGWTNQLPADDRNLYFLGTGDGSTLEDAHQNSLVKARSAVSDAVLRAAKGSASLTNKSQLVAELAKALAESAEIAETFAAPQPSLGYRAYTLLRLSKSAAVFTAQSIFVRTGVPYDNHFLDTVQSDLK